MIKRIAFIFMALMLLFCSNALAQDIEFTAVADNEQGIINISGSAPATWGNRKVAIMVMRPAASDTPVNFDALSESDFVSSIYTVTEAVCDNNGRFTAQIKFSDSAALGYYLIRAGATGIQSDTSDDKRVLFATKADAEAVLNLVNRASGASEIQAVIDGATEVGALPHDEILSLDTNNAMYASNPVTVCEFLYALKGNKYRTLASLQEAYTKGCALAEITHCPQSQTKSKIAQYASLLNIDITCNEYSKNKDAVAVLVKGNIEKLPEYKTEPEKFFAAMSAVAAINASTRDKVMGIVEEYAQSLDITLGVEYNTLSAYEVGKALVDKNFTDVKGVQDALSARITQLTRENEREESSGGGGGGGGGGGPSGVGISTPAPIDPIVEERPQTSKNRFADVTASHWAYEAVSVLSEKEIINGMGDGSFNPDGSVKREQIAKMIVLAFDIKQAEGNSFNDVDKDSWYSSYVCAALESGVVNGMGDRIFGVGKEVSRQDLMVMLHRALLNAGCKFAQADTENFSDNEQISDYAKEAVAALYGAEIVSGNNGAIEPRRICSRAEAAKLIFGAMKKVEARTEAGIYEN